MLLPKEADLHLLPCAKSTPGDLYRLGPTTCKLHYRKAVETAGSLLKRRLLKSIHAVTAQGFELKVVFFVLAVSFGRLDIQT